MGQFAWRNTGTEGYANQNADYFLFNVTDECVTEKMLQNSAA